MRSPTLDPTAGERARRLRVHPDLPPRVSDPMDSRYGTVIAYTLTGPGLLGGSSIPQTRLAGSGATDPGR